MTTVVNRVEADAASEAVFDHVCDLRTEPAWNPAARQVELLTPGPVGQGARFRGSWLGLGSGTAEILEFDRPTHWRTRCRFRGLDIDLVGDVEPGGPGSRLRLALELSARGVLKPLLPVVAAGLRVAGRANMRRLARVLEGPGV